MASLCLCVIRDDFYVTKVEFKFDLNNSDFPKDTAKL